MNPNQEVSAPKLTVRQQNGILNHAMRLHMYTVQNDRIDDKEDKVTCKLSQTIKKSSPL